jgi:hypothetical protein
MSMVEMMTEVQPQVVERQAEVLLVETLEVILQAERLVEILPEVELPEVELPEVELPEVELPEVELPEVILLEAELRVVQLAEAVMVASLFVFHIALVMFAQDTLAKR